PIEHTKFKADPKLYGLAQWYLQQAVELLFGTGAYLVSALALPKPEAYHDILDTIAKHGVVERALAYRLEHLANLRNMLAYARVRELVSREPNPLEWAMFGAMWSEHCAYKHSKRLLRTLPTSGPAVAVGPGENAGAVDLGDGLLCVFKVESHNHPSAIEPYQGAATGVGGILRDVFAMGARPTAVLNALFFGPPTGPAVRRTIAGVTGGISFYGNCVGIPDVGGHISFEPCYAENPLVNAMC